MVRFLGTAADCEKTKAAPLVRLRLRLLTGSDHPATLLALIGAVCCFFTTRETVYLDAIPVPEVAFVEIGDLGGPLGIGAAVDAEAQPVYGRGGRADGASDLLVRQPG